MRSDDSYAVLRAGGHEVAVTASALCELLPRPATLPPLADSVLVPSILRLRGEAVPALPLRGLLGLTGDDAPAGVVAVLRTAEGLLGLLVDGVAEVRRIPAAAWLPAAEETLFCDAVHLPAGGTRLLRRLVTARLLPRGRRAEQPDGWGCGRENSAGLTLL